MRVYCKLDKNGKLITSGVDWGKTPEMIVRTKRALLLKWPGHQTWSGVGRPWTYFGTRYLLAKIVSKTDKDGWFKMEIVEEVTPGSKWRSALAILKEKIRSMK